MAPTAVRWCCAAFRWTPVVFISAIVVWSYYAYVVQMCFYSVESIAEKVIYLILFHPLLVMFVWSYAKTIFTPVGTVPKRFYLPQQDVERLNRETSEEAQKNILIDFARNNNLPVQNRTHTGAPRYCEKCKCIKPDRCHHCSVCGTCVLKMDHHCPWVNNCVGFTTYKYFVMFLGYALIYCVYVAITSLKYFIKFWSGGLNHDMGKFHVLFLFFVAVMFAISLISLFGYHCYLTAKNRSTLESFRSPIFQTGPDKNGFSLGKYNNFKEIFGEDKKLWFVPVFTSAGDGVNFPTRTVDLDSDGLLADRQRWMEEGDLDAHLGNGYGSYSREDGVRLEGY